MDYKKILISLADQLDREGKPQLADIVDGEFQELLELLENGKLNFDFTQYTGDRDPRELYSNRGNSKSFWDIEA